jgi:hypothetical protein
MGSNRGADSRKKRGAARHAAGQAANEAAAEKEQFQGVLGQLRHTSADRAREAGRTAGGPGAPATGGRFAIGEMDSGADTCTEGSGNDDRIPGTAGDGLCGSGGRR